MQLARSAALSSGSLEDAFREVAAVAAKLLGVSRVGIWRFDEEHSRIHCDYLHAPQEGPSAAPDLTAAQYPVYFAAIDEERVLGADDVLADTRTSELGDDYLRPLGITSMLDAPIRAAGSMVGVVCFEHVGPARVWMDDEKHFAGAIGDLLAVAIQSAERRRAELERKSEARVTTAIAELGQELIGGFTDDSTSLMARLCQTSLRVMGCNAVHVLRRDAAHGGYVLVESAGITREEWAVSEALFIPDAYVQTERLEGDGIAVDFFSDSGSSPIDTLSSRFAKQILVITVPIRRGSEIAGLMTMQRRNELSSREFDRTERQIAKGIARIASLALETKRLIDELRAARRVKSDFLAMMSHELRTPLNAISGYAELLLDGAMGELGEEQQEALRVIHSSAVEQSRMVQGVLSVEKLERGEVRLDIAPCDPRAVLDEIIGGLAPKEGVSMAVDVSNALRTLSTDAGKLRAALREIVDNALKFTLEGKVAVSVSGTREGIVFSVEDTGIGIPAEARSEIFAAFHQVEQSSTRRFEGIGIGLYLARELVGHLGGRIDFDSEPGRGSVFRLVVPSRDGDRGASGARSEVVQSVPAAPSDLEPVGYASSSSSWSDVRTDVGRPTFGLFTGSSDPCRGRFFPK